MNQIHLISEFETVGSSIAIISLYVLVELISSYERQKNEYDLSPILEFCFTHNTLFKSPKVNIRLTLLR